MSCKLGLSVGESFAELASADTTSHDSTSHGSTIDPVRWFLPRRNLTEGLREAIGARLAQGGQIHVASTLAQHAFRRRMGAIPAFLVTTGFEHWLGLQGPVLPETPSLQPKRTGRPLNEDLIFGISERLRGDGSVDEALNPADLEFLMSKLELLKTKTIAVGLLHADKNPQHEVLIKNYFHERGFTVYCSHEFSAGESVGLTAETRGELDRWLKTIEAAYVWSALTDLRQQIDDALTPNREKWDIQFHSADILRYVAKAEFAPAARNSQTCPYLHLGLERFALLLPDTKSIPGQPISQSNGKSSGQPSIDVTALHPQTLAVQPTSAIEHGFWPVPLPTSSARGFEPGPMAFGKSLQPTVLDVLFALDRLEPIDGVSTLLNEKSRARIFETLFTLAKGIPGVTSIDPRAIALDLETTITDLLNNELVLHSLSGEIRLSGALARSFAPLLEKRRPDLRFRLIEKAEWAEARACCIPMESR